jgi:hypothetical protein
MAHREATTYADAGTAQFTGPYGAGTLGICLARPVGAPATGSDVATTCSKYDKPILYGAEAFMRLGDDEGAGPAILCEHCGSGR